jgi:glycosyltransferase involved in cell wall biosynthesis
VRYLFVHQNFPGQFLHIVRHLLAQGGHDIVFITQPNPNHINGVRKVTYQLARPINPDTHADAQDFELAMRRADAVAQTAAKLRALGFSPDIIIGHHGWGELLNLADVWPGVPMLGYHEFYYHTEGVDVGFDPEFPLDRATFARVRAKNAVNLLALTNPGHGQSPTRWQLSTYPDWARPGINLLPEGVNLATCRPDPSLRERPMLVGTINVKPSEKLVTYVARDLEPYRGFHIMMRALPAILRARRDVRVILVGGDGVSYGARLASGSWRDYMMGQVGSEIDLSRVHFPGKIDYNDYLRMLQRSDAHVYLTYPFVASWSLREALACGCAIVASDTEPVHEFVTHGRTGMLVPFLKPHALAEQVLEVLEDAGLGFRLRAAARRHAEAALSLDENLAAYERLIGRLIGASCETAAPELAEDGQLAEDGPIVISAPRRRSRAG